MVSVYEHRPILPNYAQPACPIALTNREVSAAAYLGICLALVVILRLVLPYRFYSLSLCQFLELAPKSR